MKSGIELLPDYKQATVIAVDVLVFLVKKKILDIKNAHDMGDDLTNVVLKAVQENNKSWRAIYQRLDKLVLADLSSVVRQGKKKDTEDLVASICNEDSEKYKKYIIKTAVFEIEAIYSKKYPELKIKRTAIRDRFIEWRNKAREK